MAPPSSSATKSRETLLTKAWERTRSVLIIAQNWPDVDAGQVVQLRIAVGRSEGNSSRLSAVQAQDLLRVISDLRVSDHFLPHNRGERGLLQNFRELLQERAGHATTVSQLFRQKQPPAPA